MRASCSVLLLLLSLPLWSQMVEIQNRFGGIHVRVGIGTQVRAQAVARTRAFQTGDVTVAHDNVRVRVVAQPQDGAPVDLMVDLPYGASFRAQTTDGKIVVQGLVLMVELITEQGDIELTAPWTATRLHVEMPAEPPSLTLPEGLKFSHRMVATKERTRWVLEDRLGRSHVTCGAIRVTAGNSRRVSLTDMPYPENAPVRPPWQAPAVLESLLAGTRPGRPAASAPARETVAADGTAVFRSDVRMVALTVSVMNAAGVPITNLAPEDFEVFEDGKRQDVRYSSSEKEPFNLVLHLDLSGSTQRDRTTMQDAALGFIGIARPQDRVAMYVLANDQFAVISHMATDRNRLVAALRDIPSVAGGSPLYDSLVLAYAEELRLRPQERNALIVITDGVDNQIVGDADPSMVSIDKLRKAVAGLNILIYPILLDPFTMVPAPRWIREAQGRMDSLARASGGRSFIARNARELASVYPLVAEELRSVYYLGYSPANQDFNGNWRRIEVRVKQRGARVRTRPGYYAR